MWHESAIHKLTVELKLLLVPLTGVSAIIQGVNAAKIQNTKLKHDNRPYLLK